MQKETMTLRKALAEKKMLDERIKKEIKYPFVAITNVDRPMINGVTREQYPIEAKAKWQSANAMIARREAISKAILNTNASATIKVPKFVALDGSGKKAEEAISFACAIARKSYYKDMLRGIVMDLKTKWDSTYRNYEATLEERRKEIAKQITAEFAAAPATPKQLTDRQAELEKKWEILFVDPITMKEKLENAAKAIEDYLLTIDSALGHATEVTEVTIEY